MKKHFTLQLKVTVYGPNRNALRTNEASIRVQANSLEEAMTLENLPMPVTQFVDYELIRVIEHRDEVIVWVPGTPTLQEYKLVFIIKPSLCVSREFYRTSIQYNLEDVIADAAEVVNSFYPSEDFEIKLVQVFDSKGEMVWELLQ